MKAKHIATALFAAAALAACAAPGAGKAQKKKSAPALDFHDFCSNAWIRCDTDRNFLSYAPDEEMKFTFKLQSVTNKPPEGRFFWSWKRTGDDGTEESGKSPLEKGPLSVSAKTSAPGFVRVHAQVVEADGKPFVAKKGKTERRLQFHAGACAGFDALAPAEQPRNADRIFAKRIQDVKRQLARVNFRKSEKTKIENSGFNGATLYSVSVPCAGSRPAEGFLTVPDLPDKSAKLPIVLEFDASGFEKPQRRPPAKGVDLRTISFSLRCDPGKAGARDDDFCTESFMRLVRAIQFLKTLPEWNGRDITASGTGPCATFAIWAAACGEDVTRAECTLFEEAGNEYFSACNFAKLVPGSCMTVFARLCPGDPLAPAAPAARLWNSLRCDRRAVWQQGGVRSGAPGYKGSSAILEKIEPVGYRDMTSERCIAGKPFDDLDVALRDKVVVEVILDYAKPATFDPNLAAETISRARTVQAPVVFYAAIPDKKPKAKQWEKFIEAKSTVRGRWSFSFPVYAAAGMDLPAPAGLPFFRVADANGIIRYEGEEFTAANRAMKNALSSMPKPDKEFEYAKVDLLKDDIEKMRKAKFPPAKMLKSIEMLAKKYERTDQARAEEAGHLAIGMKQAVERRMALIALALQNRPGKAVCTLKEILEDWPELAKHPVVVRANNLVKANPDIEKLAKIEMEMERLFAWNPEKSADIKKKDSELAGLRMKTARFEKSKNMLAQGEAMAILADLDNPPQPGDGQQGADGAEGN